VILIASAANNDTSIVHIHVRHFMFFSSLLREWRFGLARSGIADENLQQVHAPERRGYRLPIPSRQKTAERPSFALKGHAFRRAVQDFLAFGFSLWGTSPSTRLKTAPLDVANQENGIPSGAGARFFS
jgi:hypothetical protein